MKSRRDARNEKDFYKKMMGQAQRIDNTKQSLNESAHDVPKVCAWVFWFCANTDLMFVCLLYSLSSGAT